jgi:hypothetical protein
MLTEFVQLEHGAVQLLGDLFTTIRYRIGRDRLGLGDMYAPEASDGSGDDDDDDESKQVLAAHPPGNSPPPWE